MVSPQQIIEVQRDIESLLQRFSSATTNELLQIEAILAGWEHRLLQRKIEIEREYQLAQNVLSACLNSGHYDEDGNYHAPNCIVYQIKVDSIGEILSKLHNLISAFYTSAENYRTNERQIQELIHANIPAAIYWLRERQEALERFEKSGGTTNISPSKSSYLNSSSAYSSFSDVKGRNLTIRTYNVTANQQQLRVYDNKKTPKSPDYPNIGDAGMANIQFEQWQDSKVARIRLQWIESYPDYKKSGVGRKLLQQIETIGKENGAQEIYGVAPDSTYEREWYISRGYSFRSGTNGGHEVFKKL